MRRERQLSLVAIGVGKTDMQVLLNLFCRQMLEPFDRAYPVRKEIVREIQLRQLSLTLYAVKVNVKKRQSPAIFVDQRKRGTSDPCPFADFQPFRHSPHKTGLPAAQLSAKTYDFSALKHFSYCFLLSLSLRIPRGSPSITSDAISPISPLALAA